MRLRLTIIFLVLNIGLGLSQTQNRNSSKESLKTSEIEVVTDTIIDGKSQLIKEIKSFQDSLSKPKLEDNAHALKLDQNWLNELYSSSLYDTIYNSVRTLEYDSIYYPELPTDTLKSRLKILSAKTPFNIEYNPSLESVIKGYLKNRRAYFERLIALSEYYFPLFESKLDNYDIPLEVKYLAIVESALKPRAKSRVGATGLWQFMYTTGILYGLDVSSYVDERSDPIKSTEAAAKYLASLYNIFGDWDLALAAYNSGPGNVTKAIRRSGGYQNYWNIRPYLPRETAGYLPAFLATMYIFEYAKEHGLQPNKFDINYIETDTIHVKQMISLDQVSELTGINIEELQFLNPSYKLDIIPFIEGKNYTLRLPKSHMGSFVNNETEIYAYVKEEFEKREKPLPQFFKSESTVHYRVRSGDYLGKIARNYNVRVSDLKRWNGLRSNDIRIGQRLTLYPSNPTNPANSTASNSAPEKSSNNQDSKTYVVKSGDSLWSISQKFPGVSVQNIKDWNDISGTNLKPGMKLKISK